MAGDFNMHKKNITVAGRNLYYKNQLQKLVNSEYGFTIKIMDSENNSTHSWTVNKESHKDIMNELKKFFNNNFYEYVGDTDE